MGTLGGRQEGLPGGNLPNRVQVASRNHISNHTPRHLTELSVILRLAVGDSSHMDRVGQLLLLQRYARHLSEKRLKLQEPFPGMSDRGDMLKSCNPPSMRGRCSFAQPFL